MPEAEKETTPRPSGRPVTINPEAIAALALKIFATHGYTEVSMAQIADAAGIGRKSLYRYFPSKADLVWGGLTEAAGVTNLVMDQALQESGNLIDALHAASLAALQALPNLEVTRGRLRLIAMQSELTAQAPIRLAAQQQRTQEFLIAGGVDPLDAHYLSVAYGSLSFAAWVHWAKGEEATPAQQLKRAVTALRVPASA